MKVRLLIFSLLVLGLGSCTQYACPTYSKGNEVKEVEKIMSEDVIEEVSNI